MLCKKKLRNLCLLIVIVSFLKVHRYTYSSAGHVYDFNMMRDKKDILNIFKKNWAELVEGTDYSPDYMIIERKPGKDVPYIHPLKIKVMREKNKLAGFTSYYMENNQKGMILFLAVDHNFRGKGYGTLLMQYAMKDLMAMGAKNIGIWVLISNDTAKRLYKKLGFIEKFFDEKENLYLEYQIP